MRIAALDTNVLLDVLLPDKSFFERSASLIEDAAATGSLVICDIVYAELSVHFDSSKECDRFLRENEIRLEALGREDGFLAGRAWRNYRKAGGKRTRILPDFFIGAHAQLRASCLISRDRGFFQSWFPSLKLIDPSQMISRG